MKRAGSVIVCLMVLTCVDGCTALADAIMNPERPLLGAGQPSQPDRDREATPATAATRPADAP